MKEKFVTWATARICFERRKRRVAMSSAQQVVGTIQRILDFSTGLLRIRANLQDFGQKSIGNMNDL